MAAGYGQKMVPLEDGSVKCWLEKNKKKGSPRHGPRWMRSTKENKMSKLQIKILCLPLNHTMKYKRSWFRFRCILHIGLNRLSHACALCTVQQPNTCRTNSGKGVIVWHGIVWCVFYRMTCTYMHTVRTQPKDVQCIRIPFEWLNTHSLTLASVHTLIDIQTCAHVCVCVCVRVYVWARRTERACASSNEYIVRVIVIYHDYKGEYVTCPKVHSSWS